MILEKGEKVHIVERRYFPDDVRRHFCGEVIDSTEHLLRVAGYAWAWDARTSQFIKRKSNRERLFCLGDRLTINLLPKEADLDNVKYSYSREEGHMVTDSKSFSFNITEFSIIR
ncbi:hypothetical protein ACFL28_03670 [Candidatus Omnitrophota bacterium]